MLADIPQFYDHMTPTQKEWWESFIAEQIPVGCLNPEPLSAESFWPELPEEMEEELIAFPPPQHYLPLIQIDSDRAPPVDTISVDSHVLLDGQTDDGYEVWLAKVLNVYPNSSQIGVYYYDTKINKEGAVVGYVLDDSKERVWSVLRRFVQQKKGAPAYTGQLNKKS